MTDLDVAWSCKWSHEIWSACSPPPSHACGGDYIGQGGVWDDKSISHLAVAQKRVCKVTWIRFFTSSDCHSPSRFQIYCPWSWQVQWYLHSSMVLEFTFLVDLGCKNDFCAPGSPYGGIVRHSSPMWTMHYGISFTFQHSLQETGHSWMAVIYELTHSWFGNGAAWSLSPLLLSTICLILFNTVDLSPINTLLPVNEHSICVFIISNM